MKCPVCKTECGKQAVCPECEFGQLTPEFLNHADIENWMQNVVWPHRERYWKRLQPMFTIKNRTLFKANLDYWVLSNPNATEITLSIPYGVEAIARDCFRQMIPIDGPLVHYQKLPPLRSVYIPATVSTIDPHTFDSGTLIDVDPSSPYYYVCNAHLVDKRTSALVIGPHPLNLSNLPECITRLSSWSCSFSDSDETYVHLPNTISAIDTHALAIRSTSCFVHIPKSVSFIEKNGLLIQCWGNKESANETVYIFCDHDSRPDTWDKDWVIRSEVSCFDSNVSAYVFWQGTWHYENGKPVPNDESCGDLVSKEYVF